MADSSLDHLTQLIRQIGLQEQLGENLSKATVLLEVALQSELLQQPSEIIYPYFWAISDFLSKAVELHETAIQSLSERRDKLFFC